MVTGKRTAFDIQKILADLKATYVKTPRYLEFRGQLDRLLQCAEHGQPLPRPVTFATGETRGIALVDGAGGGKTSLVDHALRHHPAFHEPHPNTKLVVSVSVPSPATLKSIALEIIRETGYPPPKSTTAAWELWTLVKTRLACCKTVVLWIDEAHDMFRKRSEPEVQDTLRMLKSLMQGENAVIVILTGIEELWQIASCDQQVARRFSMIKLPPLSHARDGRHLARQIAIFCRQAGLAPPDDPDLIPRLIHASRERFGRCIETIIHAIEVALRSGSMQLDRQHFAEAWGMQEGCAYGRNVFLSDRWSLIELQDKQAA